MSVTMIIEWLKNHKKIAAKAILGALVALVISFGITEHNRAKRLSTELEMAQNNIEAYQDALSDSQQASGVLMLDMSKLKEQNDKLIHQIDSVREELKIKPKEITVAATQKQVLNVSKSKGVQGDLSTILIDSAYKDSIEYNPLTKVYYNISKDTVDIKIDLQNTQYLYVYKHKEYKNKKNFFQRLFTLDWKKKTVYRYKIENTNDLLKEDSVRVIQSI